MLQKEMSLSVRVSFHCNNSNYVKCVIDPQRDKKHFDNFFLDIRVKMIRVPMGERRTIKSLILPWRSLSELRLCVGSNPWNCLYSPT